MNLDSIYNSGFDGRSFRISFSNEKNAGGLINNDDPQNLGRQTGKIKNKLLLIRKY